MGAGTKTAETRTKEEKVNAVAMPNLISQGEVMKLSRHECEGGEQIPEVVSELGISEGIAKSQSLLILILSHFRFSGKYSWAFAKIPD